MSQRKPLIYTIALMCLLCALHFFSYVYVANAEPKKELVMDELTNLTSAAPYKDDLYKQLIAEWIIPASENGPQSSVADSAQQLNGFDKVTLDNTTIALLAIYQRKQLTAVLALQRIGTPITYVQLTKGADINGIELADINRRHIVLQHGAEQVRLQLFNPNSAVPDDKHKSVK